MDAGMDNYLTKPIKIDRLVEVVSELTGYKIELMAKPNANVINNGSSKYISLDYLYSISGNNKKFEKETIAIFVEQLSSKIKDINNELMPPNTKKLKFLLHNLKSIVGMFFKEDFIPQIEKLEHAAKTDSFTAIHVNECKYIITKIKDGLAEAYLILEGYQKHNA